LKINNWQSGCNFDIIRFGNLRGRKALWNRNI
jgi:hypothetical protein